jgi:O-antigen/teichoic acid export membrane protein
MFSCFVFIFYVPSEFKKFRVSLQNSKTMLVETAPAGINLLVNDGWSTISNTIAKIYGSFSDVGIFSLADKISSIFSLISLSIFTVILPKNAKRKKHNLTYDFKETLIISIGILGLALAAIVASQIFITKFFGNKFIGSLYVLDLLVFSSAITAIYSFVRDYFFIEQQTEKLLKVTLIRLSTFLLVSLILVPSMSIRGLALSNLIASLVTFLFTIFLISRLSRSSSVVA